MRTFVTWYLLQFLSVWTYWSTVYIVVGYQNIHLHVHGKKKLKAKGNSPPSSSFESTFARWDVWEMQIYVNKIILLWWHYRCHCSKMNTFACIPSAHLYLWVVILPPSMFKKCSLVHLTPSCFTLCKATGIPQLAHVSFLLSRYFVNFENIGYATAGW